MEDHAPAISSLLARPENERRIGPFVLVDELGAGGYAPVWLARETYGKAELRTAAVKLFSLEVDAPDKSRILEEARALCRVEHPSVVRFYTLAVDETAGVMGLAMEHVAGRSLEERLAREKILAVDEALRMGTAIASALAAVHSAGLVHRDVKPSNIIEEAGGAYKLIDFGIASASLGGDDVVPAPDSGAASLALASTARVSGLISGTMGYIDPACFGEGAPPTSASDLYALGATLYRCLSGELPAEKPSGAGLDPRVLTGHAAPKSLASRAEGVPRALAALVDHLLAPRPEDRPPRASWVAHQLEQIRRDLTGRRRALPAEQEGPFRGLRRFEAPDRDVFFGRTREIAAAIELLRGRGLVALVGPSGSGKSSLARAGLLPALAEGALAGFPAAWDTAIAEPGRDPRAALAQALAPFVPDAPKMKPDEIAVALARRASEADRGLVLLVDQLEELCTTSAPESRDEAAALLVQLGSKVVPGVRVVVSARRDLLDPLLALGDLGKTMARGLCLVEPLTPLDWQDIVERALDSYGYTLEDDALEKEIFQGIDATADAMPLVEFALTEIWSGRDVEKKRLTRAALAAVGGIEGALERHAEATIATVQDAPGATIEKARVVLLALTTPEGTRAAKSVEELIEIAGENAREVIKTLTEARLVVPAEGGVTLAHEALLTRWQRLAGWIAEAQGDRLLAEEIERDAARWTKDPESVLRLRGRRLEFTKELVRKNTVRLSPAARSYIGSSLSAARRGALFAAGAGTLFVLALLGAGIGYVRAVRAEEQVATERLAMAEQNRREIAELTERLLEQQKLGQNSAEELEKLAALVKKGATNLPAEPAPTPTPTPQPTPPRVALPPVAKTEPTTKAATAANKAAVAETRPATREATTAETPPPAAPTVTATPDVATKKIDEF